MNKDEDDVVMAIAQTIMYTLKAMKRKRNGHSNKSITVGQESRANKFKWKLMNKSASKEYLLLFVPQSN